MQVLELFLNSFKGDLDQTIILLQYVLNINDFRNVDAKKSVYGTNVHFKL